MKKDDKIEIAIKTIIESSIKHSQATDTGDYKTANKNYHLIKKAVDYLRESNGIEKMKILLANDQVSVRVWAATFLLRNDERQAVETLELIASQSIPHHSSDAKLVLQEWYKGNFTQ